MTIKELCCVYLMVQWWRWTGWPGEPLDILINGYLIAQGEV